MRKNIFLLIVLLCPIFNSCSKDYSKYVVTCMGDSITWGHTPQTGVQMDEPYPVVLKETLKFGHVSNYGVCSSTLCNGKNSYAPMVDRIRKIEKDSNLIIVWGGVNDVDRECEIGEKGSKDPSNVYGALYDMCNYLNEEYKNAFIMFITPLPAKIYGQYYYLHNIRDAIFYTCDLFKFPVLNLTDDNTDFEKEMEQDYSDGVHPSQAYVKKSLVPKIVDFIKKNL